MFTGLFALFSSPLGRKIALYSGLAIGLFFVYRWHVNAIRDDQQRKDQISVREQVIKEKQAEWEVEQDKLNQQKAELIEEQGKTQELLQQAKATRQAIVTDVAKKLGGLEARLNQNQTDVAAVPVTELEARIREALVALK